MDYVVTKQNYGKSAATSSASMTIEQLFARPIWVAWRTETVKGRLTKVPYQAKTLTAASSTNPTTWSCYDDAVTGAKRLASPEGPKGVGIILGQDVADRAMRLIHGEFRLIGVDLDNCLDPETGDLAPHAQEVVEKFANYAEISPSGRGVKVFALLPQDDAKKVAKLLGGKSGKTFSRGDHDEIALWTSARYFAVTGDTLAGFDRLRPVAASTIEWLLSIAGPAFAPPRDTAQRERGGTGKRRRGNGRDDSRSGKAFRLAMQLRESGKSEDDFRDALESDDELAGWAEDDRQVSRAWKGAGEIVEAHDGEIERYNGRYAAVMLEGKFRIYDTAAGTFSQVADFHHDTQNDRVPGEDGELAPVSRFWMTHPRRRSYRGVVFDPSGHAPADRLNLWRGWAVTPAGDKLACRLIRKHIREIWADGDPELADYATAWLAHMIQRPADKPGVALVLKGEKGVGKDILFERVLKPMLGAHFAKVSNPEGLTSRFNAQFATALLAHLEDAVWAGDPSKRGVLQSHITSPVMALEKKGVDVVMIDSYMRVALTTNEQFVVPATHDERRYAIFDVSSARRGDQTYIRALLREIENGGVAAFLQYLTDFDLRGFNPREVPQTRGLVTQKIETLRGVERWWFEHLQSGRLPDAEGDWREGEIATPCNDLRAACNEWIKANRHEGREATPEWFGTALTKMARVHSVRPRVGNNGRKRRYQIPSLNDCRANFEAYIGGELRWD